MRYIFIMLALIVTFSGASANPGKLLPPTLIAGPADVQAGTAYTYSYTDAFIVAPSWNITAGTATINSTWSSGSTYYASVTWTTSGTLHFFDDVVIVNKTKAVSAIALPGVTGAQHCGPATLTLTATYASPASGVRWYTASTGGTLLSSTTTYQPALTTTTTYYVEAWNSALTTSRVAVTATIHAVPDVPDDVTGDSRCGAGSVTLSATADAPGNTVLWYTAPVGGDTVYSGTTYVIPSLSNSVAYYAAGYKKSTGCVSATRLEVTADVLTGPPLLVAWGYPVRYGSGEADLKAYAYTRRYDPEQPGSEIDTADYDVLWYATPEDAEDDVSRLANTPVFTTPPITSTTTYYVRLRDEETDCRGDIIPVVAEVIPYVSNVSVRTDAVRVTGKKTELSLASATDAEMSTTLSYLDGAGRVQQNVVLRGSPSGKDVVAPYEYDKTGRTSRQYLPYIASTTNGSFHSGYAAEQASFYLASGDKIADDSAAFVKTVFQESPLGLVLEQGTAGKGFQPGQGHSSVMEYVFNTSGDYVRRFDAKGNSSGYYAAKTLTKTKAIGPDGNYTLTFTDGSGNTVLVRQWIDASIESTYTDYLETYYIYSTLGQVNFIISPKGTAELKAGSWTFSSTIKDSYCNQFKYDNKGRVIEKKVPGQAWQYIIYDPLGRVVLTQDGLLRPDNKWMFIKYDYPGNAVMTGIHTNTTYTTRAAMQGYVDGLYVSGHATYGENSWFEKQETTLEGYTNVSFPKDDIDVLSVNYFDDYDFDNTGGADASYVSAGLTGEHTPAAYSFGQATGSKRKILGTGTWLKTYVFYDDRGRTIQVQTTNSINTGNVDRVTNAYADDGRLLYGKKHHDGGAYVILNKYEYTARGDLWKVSQDNGGTGSAYQLVAQYEYNELGQLVDKKLHDTGSGAFLQSVDYRYTIRGQLKSINNSELSGNSSNDDTDTDHDDYFGMELLYSETESGLTTNNRYDGSITAMKWKRIGAASGTAGQQSYAFTYDKTGRLENAGYALKESAWDKELGAQDEAMTYDHNGNILTLQRKQRKYDDLTASYANETIDNLTYAYKSGDKNSLEKITDAASINAAAGFDNGSSSTSNDYTYDANGNLLSDKNKGIDSIKYNFLGKPIRMKFSDGKVITYVYDAGGNKLTQKLYHGDTLKNTTDYVNGFVYENGALSFFGSPEGRVINNGGTLQYEYAIADHQGNTRVVFSSVTPEADEPETGFEAGSSSEFINYDHRSSLAEMNHTAGGTYSQLLHGGYNSQVGAAKTLHVYPGDTITATVYAKYRNITGTTSNLTGFAAALTGAFGVDSYSVGEALNAYNGLDSYGSLLASGGRVDDNDAVPKGFITIMLFDKHHNFLDAAWDQMDDYEQTSTPPAKDPFDLLFKQVVIREEGYVYIFVSNENPTKVDIHFDDLKITHTKSNVIQYNEYYPFGLQTSNSWTRESSKDNNYLYNAANELNKISGWYEMYYRGYDPAIGRMLQVDPYATMYASFTTYNYAVNNPVMISDPSGGQSQAPPGVSQMGWERYGKINSMNDPNYFSMWSESIGQGNGWDDLSGGSRTTTGDLWGSNGRQILLNGEVVGYRFSGAAAQFVFGNWRKGLDQGFITTKDGYTAIMLFDNNPSSPGSVPGRNGLNEMQAGTNDELRKFIDLNFKDRVNEIQKLMPVTFVLDFTEAKTSESQPGLTSRVNKKELFIYIHPLTMNDHELLYYVLDHEFVHGLGYSNGTFDNYVKGYGQTRAFAMMEVDAYNSSVVTEFALGRNFGAQEMLTASVKNAYFP